MFLLQNEIIFHKSFKISMNLDKINPLQSKRMQIHFISINKYRDNTASDDK